MATNQLHDLFDDKTLYMISGSTEFFILSLDDIYDEPIDLSTVTDIQWLMKPASVKENYALIEKRMSAGEILILIDTHNNYTNQIQVCLDAADTEGLEGGFIHQIALIDKLGNRFIPFQGLIVFDAGIETI